MSRSRVNGPLDTKCIHYLVVTRIPFNSDGANETIGPAVGSVPVQIIHFAISIVVERGILLLHCVNIALELAALVSVTHVFTASFQTVIRHDFTGSAVRSMAVCVNHIPTVMAVPRSVFGCAADKV